MSRSQHCCQITFHNGQSNYRLIGMADHLNVDELTDYLFENDELALILKAHLDLEQLLDKLITKIFLKPGELVKRKFEHKIDILIAVGIMSEVLGQNLLAFNKLRNKFSHRYRYKLSAQDLNALKQLVGKRPAVIPKSFQKMKGIHSLALLIRATGRLSGMLELLNDISKALPPHSAISRRKLALERSKRLE
jgi:hypothetical protein